MRPVLLSVASVLVLIVPAAALPALPAVPAVADVPALPPTAAAPLGPEAALALASPTYDARMSGYLELAAGVLGMAAQEDLDSQALAAALSAAHARAVERLTDAPAPTYDPLGDLLARHDAAAKVLAAPEAERMIELLSAGTLRPGDATFDALSATLAAARLLADAEMLDAPAALAAA